MSSTTSVFVVMWLARKISSSGVFRYNPEAPHGSTVHLLYLENRNQCLRACLEESECAVVTYNETDDGYCSLYKNGSTDGIVQGYILFREETDSSCVTETTTTEIKFQIISSRRTARRLKCNITRDVNVIQPLVRLANNHRFFFMESSKTANYSIAKPRLFFSKKTDASCTALPVFHRANFRRLYFGEIYNATGYFFYHSYAFVDRCISPQGECLGMQEIQEYMDEQGNFYYDKPGRRNMTDSGLGQIFYIASIE